MLIFILKLLAASMLIAFSSWIADKKPVLAGFLIALPLTSMIALIFNYLEFKNTENSILYAKSIFLAVPLSLTFFIPFYFAEKLNNNFILIFLVGVGLLAFSFLLHQLVFK